MISNPPRPADITIDNLARQMRILWQDEHASEYALDMLREVCPCAECNERRANDDSLRLVPAYGPERHEVHSAELVGHYAMQTTWRDGHRTGIYTWDYLRSLCTCQACRPSLSSE